MRGEKNITERTKDELFNFALPEKYTIRTCESLGINNWADSAIFDFWVNGIYELWEENVRHQKLLLARLAYDYEERDLNAEIEEFRSNPLGVIFGDELENKKLFKTRYPDTNNLQFLLHYSENVLKSKCLLNGHNTRVFSGPIPTRWWQGAWT